MPGINLSQSYNASAAAVAKKSASDTGFLISIVILIVTLLAYGGLKLATQSYSSKKAGIESQISAVRDSLSGGEVEKVADFQKRMDNINSNFTSLASPNEKLNAIAGAMVAGSVASSVDSKEGVLTAIFIVDNYQTASKQILGLKNEFDQAKISKMERGGDGKILMTLELGN